jgi:hypothetical protein
MPKFRRNILPPSTRLKWRCWESLSLPFLQPCINPSTSQHRHFSPEDGGIVFLRNVGIYRRGYTAPKPRRTSSSSSPPWKPQISHYSDKFLDLTRWTVPDFLYKSRRLTVRGITNMATVRLPPNNLATSWQICMKHLVQASHANAL